MNAEAPSVLVEPHDEDDARWLWQEGVRNTSFLLVLTGQSVVTLSSAGRARISLKYGVGVPHPNDLVSLPPPLF
jgi:hypothetical protein